MDAVDGYYITYMKLFSLSLYSLHLFTALHEATAQDSYCSTYHIEVPLHQVTIISSARCSFFIPQHFLKSVCSCVFFALRFPFRFRVFVLKSCSHHRGRDTHCWTHTHTQVSCTATKQGARFPISVSNNQCSASKFIGLSHVWNFLRRSDLVLHQIEFVAPFWGHEDPSNISNDFGSRVTEAVENSPLIISFLLLQIAIPPVLSWLRLRQDSGFQLL